MLIYLQHKDHGNHIVYSEEDAVECEKNGWKRAPFPGTEPKPVEPAAVATEEQDWLGSAPDIPAEVLPKSRGRRKSAD